MEGFLRPEITVLGEDALVPERNLIAPPPNQFTHELTRPLPFYYAEAQEGEAPAGQFPAGTRVVLLRYEGGRHCRVADGHGLYVETEYDGLSRIEPSPGPGRGC
jgi:hypothetical protein